jgi:hypothetical protein
MIEPSCYVYTHLTSVITIISQTRYTELLGS